MLIDNYLELEAGGVRPHFSMVGLKTIPNAVEVIE